jgi:hypothetical protein
LPLLSSWWHAGEEGALVVFTKRVLARFLFVSIAFVGFWIFIPLFHQRPLALALLAAVALPRVLVEARRAIIFTETQLIYRPPLAGVRRIPIVGIQGLRSAKVARSYLLRAAWVPGVLLRMKTGEMVSLPLDLKERHEILQRLSALVGEPIEQ